MIAQPVGGQDNQKGPDRRGRHARGQHTSAARHASHPDPPAAPSHALVLREGPKPTRPHGRIPRVARLLALTHHFVELLEMGAVETQAKLAELAKLTPARVTQIMNLLGLAPDIQKEIFFLALVTEGRPTITERDLRAVLKTVVWSEQREQWAELRPVPHARESTAPARSGVQARGCAPIRNRRSPRLCDLTRILPHR